MAEYLTIVQLAVRFRLGRRAFETLIEGCARTVKGRLARDVDEMGERIFRQDVSNTSVGEMIGQVAEDLSLLMRHELDLTKAEVKQEITKADKAAGLIVTGVRASSAPCCSRSGAAG